VKWILATLLFASTATATDLKPPQFVPCITVFKNIKYEHVCVLITVEGKRYSMMFSQDGTTIVALIRIHDDDTEEVLYLIPDPIRV